MKKINDIYGKYTSDMECFNDENSWGGRILVDQDGTFEGAVLNEFQKKAYFVFGLLKNNAISLIACTDETDELPKEYNGEKNNNHYCGEYSAKDISLSIPLGEFEIGIYPAELTREISKYELDVVSKQIKSLKEGLGPRSRKLYEHHIAQSSVQLTIKK